MVSHQMLIEEFIHYKYTSYLLMMHKRKDTPSHLMPDVPAKLHSLSAIKAENQFHLSEVIWASLSEPHAGQYSKYMSKHHVVCGV